MPTIAKVPALFEELGDFLVSAPPRTQLLAFRPSEAAIER
jgi:hypothetical protein